MRAESYAAKEGDPIRQSRHNVRASVRVLVVDDEPAVRSFIVRTLSRLGYEVHEAADGAAALRLARDFAAPLDVLITDVTMPDMGGLQLADAFGETSPRTRVLFVSGAGPDEGPLRRLRARSPFLQKPFFAADLVVAVERLVAAECEVSP